MKKNEKKKIKSTKCPACQAETSECWCGLSDLVIQNADGIGDKEISIISIKAEDPNRPSYFVYTHAVCLLNQRIVAQYLGKDLITSVGPYNDAEMGKDIYIEILKALKAKACTIIGWLPEEVSAQLVTEEENNKEIDT